MPCHNSTTIKHSRSQNRYRPRSPVISGLCTSVSPTGGSKTPERLARHPAFDEGALGAQQVVGVLVGNEALYSQPLGHRGQVLPRVLSHAPAPVLAGRARRGKVVE